MEITEQKTALIFLADGFEEVEALTIVDYLRRAGVAALTVAVPTDAMKKDNMVTSSHKITVVADYTWKQFEKEFTDKLPDLVFAPGGMPGSVNLGEDKKVLDFFDRCFDANKFVAAICAAPALVLSKTKALMGKKWTCAPGMEERAEGTVVAGSTYVNDRPFITDGNVITGRGAGAAEEMALELVWLLCGSETSKSLRGKICAR